MKEHIYTIPILDGFNEKTECPFCSMKKVIEDKALDFILTSAYMEDDIRMETDKTGFCGNHYEKMYEYQNRLGLALMCHTHISKFNKNLKKEINKANIDIKQKKSLFSKPKETKLNDLIKYLKDVQTSCYLCEKVENTFIRYIETFFYLYKENKEIKEKLLESQGFCLQHFTTLLEQGEKFLNEALYYDFINVIIPLQEKNLLRLEDEIEWFTDKFDYRYKDEPWKNSKDALPRLILKLGSIIK